MLIAVLKIFFVLFSIIFGTLSFPKVSYGVSTSNMEIITYCREQFNFELPSVILARHTSLFLDKLRRCDNCLIEQCYAQLTHLFCLDFVYL